MDGVVDKLFLDRQFLSEILSTTPSPWHTLDTKKDPGCRFRSGRI